MIKKISAMATTIGALLCASVITASAPDAPPRQLRPVEAFLSASHPRLGRNSPAALLPRELFERIGEYLLTMKVENRSGFSFVSLEFFDNLSANSENPMPIWQGNWRSTDSKIPDSLVLPSIPLNISLRLSQDTVSYVSIKESLTKEEVCSLRCSGAENFIIQKFTKPNSRCNTISSS